MKEAVERKCVTWLIGKDNINFKYNISVRKCEIRKGCKLLQKKKKTERRKRVIPDHILKYLDTVRKLALLEDFM